LNYATKSLKLEDLEDIISCSCHEFLSRKAKQKKLHNRSGSFYLMKPIIVWVLSSCCICSLSFRILKETDMRLGDTFSIVFIPCT